MEPEMNQLPSARNALLSVVLLSAALAGCGGGGNDLPDARAAANSMATPMSAQGGQYFEDSSAIALPPGQNSAISAAQLPISLGAAATFAILSKSGVTDVYPSQINGDVGASPISGTALLVTCGEVKNGIVYSVDAAGPLPCVVTAPSLLTTAVLDMEAAYTDAAGRTLPDHVELGAGEIGGLTLAPGLYKWGTGVAISTDVTLSGGPDDVWIFQIAGTLTQASATKVTLSGGAQAKNIFWQVADVVYLGTTAHFEGVLLAKTMIAAYTGATITGRLLAQSAVTLQMNTVTGPVN
jgi:hypothetical protein